MGERIESPPIFESDRSTLQYFYCKKNDKFALNSLEVLDRDEFIYRCLKNSGFEVVVFLGIASTSQKENVYQFFTYDRNSHYAFSPEGQNILKQQENKHDFTSLITSIQEKTDKITAIKGNNTKNITQKYQNNFVPVRGEITFKKLLSIEDEIFYDLWKQIVSFFSTEGHLFGNLRFALVMTEEIFIDISRNKQLKRIFENFFNNKIVVEKNRSIIVVCDICEKTNYEKEKEKRRKNILYINPPEDDELKNLLLRYKLREPELFNYSLFDVDLLIERVREYVQIVIKNELDFSFSHVAALEECYNSDNKSDLVKTIQEHLSQFIENAQKNPIKESAQSKNKAALSINRLPKKLLPSHILAERIKEEEAKRKKIAEITPEDIATAIKTKIKGQDENIDSICDAAINHIKEPDPERPLTILILGKAGIGKSETFITLSKELKAQGFNIGDLIEVKLNQYNESHHVNTLRGGTPTYAGYGEPTIFDKLNNNEFNLVLFDEMEKAHPDVWKYLMEIINTGVYNSAYHKDENGHNKDIICKKTIFAFTSNLSIDENQYQAIPTNVGRDDFLFKKVLEVMTIRGVDESLSRPFIRRMRRKRLYNSIPFMSVKDRILIAVNIVKSIFNKKKMEIYSIDPNLVVMFYDLLVNNEEGGVSGMINYIDEYYDKKIDSFRKCFSDKNVYLNGTLDSLLVEEAVVDDLDYCIEKAKSFIEKNYLPNQNSISTDLQFQEAKAKLNSADIVAIIKSRIIGQDENIDEICTSVIRHIQKGEPARPLTILILGTTGIGKSKTFQILSEELKKQGINIGDLIEVPLNEYGEKHHVDTLRGAPPSYTGYGEPTILDQLNDHEYNIVLFDEMEKAHSEVWKYLMEMINKGIYKSQHHKKDIMCKKTIFAFTSNLIIDETHYHSLPREARDNFLVENITSEMARHRIETSLSRPFIGRMRRKRLYNSLPFMTVKDRVRIAVNIVKSSLNEVNIKVGSISPNLIFDLYNMLLNNIKLGVRGIIDRMEESFLDDTIDKYENVFSNKNVRLNGSLDNLLIEEASVDDLEQSVEFVAVEIANSKKEKQK